MSLLKATLREQSLGGPTAGGLWDPNAGSRADSKLLVTRGVRFLPGCTSPPAGTGWSAEGSRLALPLLLVQLHELVKSLSNLKKERSISLCSCQTARAQEQEPTCPDGFCSLLDNTEKVLREAPLAFSSIRRARSSSLHGAKGKSAVQSRTEFVKI